MRYRPRILRLAPTSGTGPADEAPLRAWLAAAGVDAARLEPMVGDVSSRSYLRVHLRGGAETLVLARYPPALAAAQARFRRAARLLARAGVRVPRLLADDPAAGLALLEDLGRETLNERSTSWNALAPELRSALDAAARIAALDRRAVAALGCEPLAAPLLRRELEQTEALLFAPRGLATRALAQALDALCARLGAGPLVPCHRDFMARNLVPLADRTVGVLDFQDLRLGPPAYDLASLLNDTLFADAALEARLVAERLGAPGGDEAYARAVAQRGLKAVGTYLRFAADGKRRHLALVEPTLARALAALARLPEAAAAIAPLRERIAAAGAEAARADC